MLKLTLLALILMPGLFSCSTLYSWGIRGETYQRSAFHPLWIKNHDPKYDTGNLPIGLQSPLIHEGLVYIGHNAGEMRAYELNNGREVWRVRDNGAYHAGPIVIKDRIIYGTIEGRVYSRHRLSGELHWNIDLGSAVESEGVLFRGRLYFHTRNHKVFCLDAETGKILWAYKRSVPFLTTLQRVSHPLAYKDKLFVGFADGSVVAFSLEEGVLLWERKIVSGPKFVDVDSSPLIFNNKLVMGSLSGPLTVINLNNGLIERKLKHNVTRRPILWKNQLLVGTADGELILFDQNLHIVQQKKLSNATISSISPWKGGLAASDVEGQLFFIDQSFELKSRYHLGHTNSAVFGHLVAQEGKLAVYSSRNRLYLFQ